MSRPDLLLRERHERIQQLLKSDGRVLAADLAAEFKVSEDTVRRDLRDLAAHGLCERVYGGALPPARFAGDLALRQTQQQEQKARIARLAASQIEPGMTVFFDAGSTNLAIAKALDPDLAITAITNAPLIAVELLQRPSGTVIQLGGDLDRHVGGATGLQAIRALERLSPDLCVIGACGIDAEAGISVFYPQDAAFKDVAASRSRQIMVAVTADKIGTAAPFRVMDSQRCNCIVSDQSAPASQIEAFRQMKIKVLLSQTHP